METTGLNISFALLKISTEQFAIIEETFNEKGAIRFAINLRFSANEDQKLLAIFSSFVFECDTKPILKIEGGCHFKLTDESWSNMLNVDKTILHVPKELLMHLSMFTIGTTRGILHSKTENTEFNKYLIPTINVADLVKSDADFSLNNKTV